LARLAALAVAEQVAIAGHAVIVTGLAYPRLHIETDAATQAGSSPPTEHAAFRTGLTTPTSLQLEPRLAVDTHSLRKTTHTLNGAQETIIIGQEISEQAVRAIGRLIGTGLAGRGTGVAGVELEHVPVHAAEAVDLALSDAGGAEGVAGPAGAREKVKPGHTVPAGCPVADPAIGLRTGHAAACLPVVPQLAVPTDRPHAGAAATLAIRALPRD
jgi:hypothetical protein